MKRLSARTERLGTESAFTVLARARQLEAAGRDIVHLEIGEPDFDTPDHVVAAGRAAIADGLTGYGPAAGSPELRASIADVDGAARGVELTADNVLITPGGKPVMFYLLLTLAEAGDEVIYPDPGFPIYESMIRYCGAQPVPIPLVEERGFGFDIDELTRLVTDRTKLLILNSPSNPTGGVLDDRLLDDIADLAADADLWVLSDEIYRRLAYDGDAPSLLSRPGAAERTVVLDGHSKCYAMTGWRLGYAIGPPAVLHHLEKLQVNSTSCAATFTQVAGLAAITGPQDTVVEMRETFRARRDHVVGRLNKLPGVSCAVPAGAFYAFPNITGTSLSSDVLANRLLDEAGVAVLAGTAFGGHGEGYLRLSYAASIDDLDEACDRIEAFLG